MSFFFFIRRILGRELLQTLSEEQKKQKKKRVFGAPVDAHFAKRYTLASVGIATTP